MSSKKNSWGTAAYRHRVMSKIEEAVQKSAMPPAKSSVEMEKDIFRKSNSKGEYVATAARLIIDFRRMERKPDPPRIQVVLGNVGVNPDAVLGAQFDILHCSSHGPARCQMFLGGA